MTAAAINMAAAVWGVKVEDILSSSREAKFVTPRHVAMMVLKSHGMSNREIGDAFDRDHSSVVHAVRATKHNLLYAKDREELKELIRKVELALKGMPTQQYPVTHCSGFVDEKRVVRYILELRGTDLEWAFKHGVRFEDGYLMPLSVKEVPLGILSVIVEHERDRYDYLHVQSIRRPYRGSTV